MIEIERKFLVTRFPQIELDRVPIRSVSIRQGYLTRETDSIDLRLRQMGADYFMTLKSDGKSDGGLSRMEYEFPIDENRFDDLWPLTAGRRVEKTRHIGKLPDGNQFELDIFAEPLAPLMMVEVEFSSEDAARAFTPPAWFGREVTQDRRYRNKALALAAPG